MNSSLVEYTRLSPNNSGRRTHAIDRITPHCVVGQLGAASLGEWFSKTTTQASCNYAIDKDGRVCLIVDEDCRSWCSSSNANDQRAVTIECASGKEPPYEFTSVVYNTLIDLCVDICERHGKTALIWISDREEALDYEPGPAEMLLTAHRFFSATDCPGEWMMAHMSNLASAVTARLAFRSGGLMPDEKVDAPIAAAPHGTPRTLGTALAGKTNAEAVSMLGELARQDAKTSGILASLTCAQAILESGYGRSELSVQANNLFGMKAKLSGNTWIGSVWDGTSVYSKLTAEYGVYGTLYHEQADFRRYADLESSMADHSAYLAGAMNGSWLRYAGIKGEKDFDAAARILLAGGYATDPAYPSKLRSIRDQWGLGELDGEAAPVQLKPEPQEPYLVRVSIPDLRIRSGPGTQYEFRRYIPVGVYTIVETQGSWGRLKSGAGWICLDYAARIR